MAANNLGSLSIDINANIDKLKLVFDQIEGLLKKLNVQLRTNTDQVAALGTVLSNITAQANTLSTAVGQSVAAVGSSTGRLGSNFSLLGQNIAAVGTNTQKLGSNFSAFNKTLAIVGQGTGALGSNFSVLGQAATAAGVGTQNVNQQVAKSVPFFQRMTAGIAAVNGAFGNMTGSLLGANRTLGSFVGTIIATNVVWKTWGALIRSVREGLRSLIEFDQGLKNIQAITRATAQEMITIQQTLKSLAVRTPFSPAQITDAFTQIGQAGFSAAESLKIVESVLNISIGTLTSMDQSVKVVTTSLRAFGLQAIEAGRVANVLTAAVNSSKLTIEGLNTALNFAAPIAAAAGLSLEQTAAALGVMANQGIKFSTQGTGLRQVLSALLAPADKFKKILVGLDISINDINPLLNNLGDILERLHAGGFRTAASFAGLDKRTASAAVSLIRGRKAFLDLERRITGTQAALLAADTQMSGLQKTLERARQRFQALANEPEVIEFLFSLSDGLQAVTRSFEAARIKGTAFTTAMRGAGSIIGTIVDALGSFRNAAGGLITTFTLVASTLFLMIPRFVALNGTLKLTTSWFGWAAAAGTGLAGVLGRLFIVITLATLFADFAGAMRRTADAEDELAKSLEHSNKLLAEREKVLRKLVVMRAIKPGLFNREENIDELLRDLERVNKAIADAAVDVQTASDANIDAIDKEFRKDLDTLNGTLKTLDVISAALTNLKAAQEALSDTQAGSLDRREAVKQEAIALQDLNEALKTSNVLSADRNLLAADAEALAKSASADLLKKAEVINSLFKEQNGAITRYTKLLKEVEKQQAKSEPDSAEFRRFGLQIDDIKDKIKIFSIGLREPIEKQLELADAAKATAKAFVDGLPTFDATADRIEVLQVKLQGLRNQLALQNKFLDFAESIGADPRDIDEVVAGIQRTEAEIVAFSRVILDIFNQLEVKENQLIQGINESIAKFRAEARALEAVSRATRDYNDELTKLDILKLGNDTATLVKRITLAGDTAIAGARLSAKLAQDLLDSTAAEIALLEKRNLIDLENSVEKDAELERLLGRQRVQSILLKQAGVQLEIEKNLKETRLGEAELANIVDNLDAQNRGIDLKIERLETEFALREKLAELETDELLIKLERAGATEDALEITKLEAREAGKKRELIVERALIRELQKKKAVNSALIGSDGELDKAQQAIVDGLRAQILLRSGNVEAILAEIAVIEAQKKVVDSVGDSWRSVSEAATDALAEGIGNFATGLGGLDDIFKSVEQSLRQGVSNALADSIKDKIAPGGFDDLFKNNILDLGGFIKDIIGGNFTAAFGKALEGVANFANNIGSIFGRISNSLGLGSGSGSSATGLTSFLGDGSFFGAIAGGFLGSSAVAGNSKAGRVLGTVVGSAIAQWVTGTQVFANITSGIAGAFVSAGSAAGAAAGGGAAAASAGVQAAVVGQVTGAKLGFTIFKTLAKSIIGAIVGAIIGAIIAFGLPKRGETRTFQRASNKLIGDPLRNSGVPIRLADFAGKETQNLIRPEFGEPFAFGASDKLVTALSNSGKGALKTIEDLRDVLIAVNILLSTTGGSFNTALATTNAQLFQLLESSEDLNNFDFDKFIGLLEGSLGSFANAAEAINERIKQFTRDGEESLTFDELGSIESFIRGISLIFANNFPAGVDVARRALNVFAKEGKLDLDALTDDIQELLEQITELSTEITKKPLEIVLTGGGIESGLKALRASIRETVSTALVGAIGSALTLAIVQSGVLTEFQEALNGLLQDVAASEDGPLEDFDARLRQIIANAVPGLQEIEQLFLDITDSAAGLLGLPLEKFPIFFDGIDNFLRFSKETAGAGTDFLGAFTNFSLAVEDLAAAKTSLANLQDPGKSVALVLEELAVGREGVSAATVKVAAGVYEIALSLRSADQISKSLVQEAAEKLVAGEDLNQFSISAGGGKQYLVVTGSLNSSIVISAGLGFKKVSILAGSAPEGELDLGLSEADVGASAKLEALKGKTEKTIDKIFQDLADNTEFSFADLKERFLILLGPLGFEDPNILAALELFLEKMLFNHVDDALENLKESIAAASAEVAVLLGELAENVSDPIGFAGFFSSLSQALDAGIIDANTFTTLLNTGLENLQDTLPAAINIAAIMQESLDDAGNLDVDKFLSTLTEQISAVEGFGNALRDAINTTLSSGDVRAGVKSFTNVFKKSVGDALLEALIQSITNSIFLDTIGPLFSQVGELLAGAINGSVAVSDIEAFVQAEVLPVIEAITSLGDATLAPILQLILDLFADTGLLDAYSDLSDEQGNQIDELKSLADAWRSIVDNLRDVRNKIQFGEGSPDNVLAQIDTAEGRLDEQLAIFRNLSKSDEDRQAAGSEIVGLVDDLFNLANTAGDSGVGIFQQGSLAFETFSKDLVGLLNEVEVEALTKISQIELMQEQVSLLAEIAANTAPDEGSSPITPGAPGLPEEDTLNRRLSAALAASLQLGDTKVSKTLERLLGGDSPTATDAFELISAGFVDLGKELLQLALTAPRTTEVSGGTRSINPEDAGLQTIAQDMATLLSSLLEDAGFQGTAQDMASLLEGLLEDMGFQGTAQDMASLLEGLLEDMGFQGTAFQDLVQDLALLMEGQLDVSSAANKLLATLEGSLAVPVPDSLSESQDNIAKLVDALNEQNNKDKQIIIEINNTFDGGTESDVDSATEKMIEDLVRELKTGKLRFAS